MQAVPVLVRRIAEGADPQLILQLPRPVRVPKTKLVTAGELERYIELAARRVGGRGGVLVVLDAHDDCPAELGPALLDRARVVRGDTPIAVVLAKREFEAWFLAGALVSGTPRQQPEEVRDAKKRVGPTYKPTADQAAFTARLDLDVARLSSPSFDRCCREVERLLRG